MKAQSLSIGFALAFGITSVCAQVLPDVIFPSENPYSEEKRVLGKILFWDEQLSSDNTMSCGTCHISQSGGTDPRIGINPGPDALFGTPDDISGSPGVINMNTADTYEILPPFWLEEQVTGRFAPPSIMAMFADQLFWDGRASGEFVDPQTGVVLISSNAALESQAVGPILSDIEMAHEGRNWQQVIDKLTNARPLALASNLPADLSAVINTSAEYSDLFNQAFGDPAITAGRIGMAIATYERTLVPDQSPFDLVEMGDSGAMTPAQHAGLEAFQGSRCTTCHDSPQFTKNEFHNIGIRPPSEDLGRFEVTGNQDDRGRFKTPTLRNAGLRNQFMHNGAHSTMEDVFDFYAHRNGLDPFPENLDSEIQKPIIFAPADQANIIDFIENGLTDPRVANATFPFDRPTLHSELASDNPAVLPGGVAGSGGIAPGMIAVIPPNIGNADFKVGIENALGGAQAWVAVSSSPPVGGMLPQDELLGPITLSGAGVGGGFGTMHYPIADHAALDGTLRYMQWIVADPAAPGGQSASPAAELAIFCSKNGLCINACAADITGDGLLNFFDVSGFLAAFSSGDLIADFTGDGALNFLDVSAFLSAFGAGCP